MRLVNSCGDFFTAVAVIEIATVGEFRFKIEFGSFYDFIEPLFLLEREHLSRLLLINHLENYFNKR